MRKSIKNTPLPLDLPTPSARPTGNPLDLTTKPTLPLSNALNLRRCVGAYTEVDRKLWTLLAALAWSNLDKKRIHEADLRDLARTFREAKGSSENGTRWLMASARRLQQSALEWEDDEEIGAVPLLGGLKITKADWKIYYQFDDFLIEQLLENKRFSRLRLYFMIGLSGKYSVSLYMLFETVANMREPVLDLTIPELRDALSVPAKKLERWVDLRRFAIDPALKEINENPEAAGFSVEMEPILRGRAVDRVRFTVTKTETRKLEDKTAAMKAAQKRGGPRLTGAIIDEARGKFPALDIDAAEASFWEIQKAREIPLKNLRSGFLVHCQHISEQVA